MKPETRQGGGVGGADDRYLFPEIADQAFEDAIFATISAVGDDLAGLTDEQLLAERDRLLKSNTAASRQKLAVVIKRLRQR